jgi:hypothetical protein
MIRAATLAFLLLGSLACASTIPQIGSPAPLASRIEDVSAHFLGRPYVLGPLGEGPSGEYDKDPLYRFDVFDCTTFVETVMALSLAKDFADFERLMNLIRYKDGTVSYVARNHFTDADWNPNNIAAGFLKDITQTVAGKSGVKTATALIDKANWYRKTKHESVGQDIKPEMVSIPYVALDAIFAPDGEVDTDVLDRIPSGAVVNVVRPNWDLLKAIGTRMNVSHQVLMIRKDGRLLVRQATSVGKKQVVDMDAVEFMRPMLQSETIKGLNFLEVVER